MTSVMKPNRRRWGSALVALAIVGVAAAPARGQGVWSGCPFEIEGIWKPQATVEVTPALLSFSADGWVSVLESAVDTRAHDFDVAAQARYRLAMSPTSMRIAFEATRGNDLLPAGTSTWEVAEYSDTTFTTLNRESGERSYWARVQTHRYFLTLAARRGVGGLSGATFVMWTSFDGQTSVLAALGVHGGRGDAADTAATFGRIPLPIAQDFASEGNENNTRAILRIEVSEAEYHRTHAVFASWDERAKNRRLPAAGPYQLLSGFLGEAIERLNRCGTKIELPAANAAAAADANDLSQQALAFMQRLRAANRNRHVTDGEFPAAWQPPPAL